MYKKILVPVDGSGLSECVFDHAKAVAKGCQVPEIDLLYVVPPFSPPWSGEDEVTGTQQRGVSNLREESEKRAEAWGKEYLAKIAKEFKGAGVAATKSVVLHGNPAEKILDYASQNRVDLIIMSTHGRSGPSRWVFGSTSEKVVRQTAVPVMVIRPAGCVITA